VIEVACAPGFLGRWSIQLTSKPYSQIINELGHCEIQIRTTALKFGQYQAAYGTTATLHVVHWKSGPYWVATALKPSGTLRTVGMSSSLWGRLAVSVFPQFGHRSFSHHSSVHTMARETKSVSLVCRFGPGLMARAQFAL
jgi:hypothetical protein